jgi:ABC-type phosphate transport system substrate-binding protein
MKNVRLALLAGVAVVGSFGLIESANAQTTPTQAIYSGGGTLASLAYRQLFDCWAVPIGPLSIPVPGCTNSNGNISGGTVQILYAPVGSGAGKRAFANHNGTNNATLGLGTPAASNTVPYSSTTFPFAPSGYPNFHFAGSDDVLTLTDVALYNSNGGPANYGAILQIPAFSTTVAIPFNGKDGNGNALTIVNSTPTGGSSGLNLSRKAFCGIFSGHITKWNNPILTALNGGTPLGTGNITVVHRSDSSGTTFLTSNALIAQCAGVFGPNNETDPTPALYEFIYTDRLAPLAQCNVAIPVRGTNSINWPDLGNDQCGQPIASRNSGGGTYLTASASGSAGVVSTVTSTNGAIGYVSPDFVQLPPSTTGLPAANLESQFDIDNNTGAFQPPTPTGASIAMSAANPNFDPTTIVNPINWSRQGVVPNPLLPKSYPISGFTWFDYYQCYRSADLSAIQGYLTYHYSDPSAGTILAQNGFAPIPSNWLSSVSDLAFNSSVALGNCGTYAGQ